MGSATCWIRIESRNPVVATASLICDFNTCRNNSRLLCMTVSFSSKKRPGRGRRALLNCKSHAKSPALAESGEPAVPDDALSGGRVATLGIARQRGETRSSSSTIARRCIPYIRLTWPTALAELSSRPSRYIAVSFRTRGAVGNPALGAVNISQSNVITQRRLRSYIRY